jgi:hypothetical protein
MSPEAQHRFGDSTPTRQRSLASEAFRYEHWLFASAQLSHDPSLVPRLDFDSRGSAEWTLRKTGAGHRSVPEAAIVGCGRAEGRWRANPGLIPGRPHVFVVST